MGFHDYVSAVLFICEDSRIDRNGVLFYLRRLPYLTAVFQQRKKISDTVELLATNHMPHLQASLDAHGESLRILSSDVRNIDTKVDSVEQRLDDTKAFGVHALGESF